MAAVLNIRRLVWFGGEVCAMHAAASSNSAEWLSVGYIPKQPFQLRCVRNTRGSSVFPELGGGGGGETVPVIV